MGKVSLKGMIESVIADLTNNEPINHYALKLQVISRTLKNEIFSQWLAKEIDGYIDNDIIPGYRKLTAQVKADIIIERGFNKTSISDYTLPLYPLGLELAKEISTINIRESVISLTKLLEDNGPIAFSINDYEKIKLSKIYQDSTILSAHKPINKSDIELIIHKFKSTLLDIFMEFNETILEDEIDFDIMTKKKDIDKIIKQTINTGIYFSENASANINNSTVVGGVENKIQIGAETKADLKGLINKIEQLSTEIEADREDIATEILKIRNELDNTIQRPKIIKSALNALKGITIGVAGNKVTDLINAGMQIIKDL